MAPPTQTLLNLIALLAKPMGGDRPIALTCMFYVLWSGIRSPSIDPFEAKFVQFWDTAVKGSSALRATLERRLFDELHTLEGDIAFALYWDLETFYDSIKFRRLIALAIEVGYSIHIFVMDLMFHLAPRILKWNSWFSGTIGVSKGILAGSKRSNTFSRLMLYPIIAEMHKTIPKSIVSRLRLYVDDISQNVYGKLAAVMKESVHLVRSLYTKLTSAELIISPKSAAVCSDNAALVL